MTTIAAGILEDLGNSNKYVEFPSDTTFRLYPFEEEAMTLIVEAVFQPHDDITEIDDSIYDDWKRQIANGAKAILFDMPGKTWTNHALADKCRRDFESGVAQARIQKEQAHTQGFERVRMRPYGWV